MTSRDRDLGMDRRVSRRDFLGGVVLAAGAAAMPAWARALAAAEAAGEYYPPILTGLRGSHDGSWEVAHALRDGTFWATAGEPADNGEEYDLVVVGGGISGLAAARYFRQAAGARARILILDNHDDFGGHAKRNEFHEGGRRFLGYGGTYAIESPAPYSKVARRLIADLGIDVGRYEALEDGKLFESLGLRHAVFFDRETFGADRLVPAPEDDDPETWPAFVEAAPLSEAARRDLLKLVREPADYLPGLSVAEKKAKLARVSYADFLTKTIGVDAGVVALFQSRPHGLYGFGIDAVSAQDAWGLGLPGFAGMKLTPEPGPGMGLDAIRHPQAEDYFFHFPDGGASIARLLLRGLVPAAVPGRTADDIVTARTGYAKLDAAGSPVRVRLRSTVVRVRHAGPAGAPNAVEVAYARDGKVAQVRGKRCVLACWHQIIPYICPELPEKQKQALADAIKVPLIYTSVLLADWQAFQKLGVDDVHAPAGFYNGLELNAPVSIGAHRASRTPKEPVVVHLGRTPCAPGQPAREQHRAGRLELYTTPFADLERSTRDQLARVLGPGGFDPVRDIRAITINRWPHGYAYQYNSLWDPFWLAGGEQPCQTARRRHGLIAIANADAGAYSYTDGAIDQAHRAVRELLS